MLLIFLIALVLIPRQGCVGSVGYTPWLLGILITGRGKRIGQWVIIRAGLAPVGISIETIH